MSGRTGRIFEPVPSETVIIKIEKPELNRKTPSSLEGESYAPKTEKYDSSSDTLEKSEFSAADFGTLVHDYLRAQAEGIRPGEYEPPVKLFKQLSAGEIAKVKEECIKMCRDFSVSELGKAAYSDSDSSARAKGRLLKAEWAFRMFYEGSIWTGSIDLIFENPDGSYTIVDYKSDEKIGPEKYVGQQKCYKIAASKMLGIPESGICTKLWYLRHNKEVEL